jgi:AraC-like DNA-binding protein
MSYEKQITTLSGTAIRSENSASAFLLAGTRARQPESSVAPVSTTGPLDWRVRKILLFIDAENGKIGQDMAEICRKLDLGISADYAVKLFKKITGTGFREYAAKKRLTKAASQLIETSLSIKVIAADLGYNSPQDFSRRFKFQYRVKPTEFRKQQHL